MPKLDEAQIISHLYAPSSLPIFFGIHSTLKMTAYVESFYVEPTEEAAPSISAAAAPVAEQQVFSEVIPTAFKTQQAPVSDYCGFESDEIPPIYRAQLRELQKEKLIAASAAEKSAYVYTTNSATDELQSVKEVQNKEPSHHHTAASSHYYVPGFSPPQQSDEVLKRDNHALPKSHAIVATEHVYNMGGGRLSEASQYVLMANEDPKSVNGNRKSTADTLVSYTAASEISMSEEESVLTAKLGPALGTLPIVSPVALSMPSKISRRKGPSNEKYAGLSAFRPVTNPIESAYAAPDLN
uniref:Uncharacterized protein n=1 Tax=Caenorhabditis japonica TaxID=281687 RepID=A0A8R1I409_CAEJA